MEFVTIVKTQESIPNLKKIVMNFYSWRHWSKDHVKNQTKDVQDLVKKDIFSNSDGLCKWQQKNYKLYWYSFHDITLHFMKIFMLFQKQPSRIFLMKNWSEHYPEQKFRRRFTGEHGCWSVISIKSHFNMGFFQ